MVSHTRWLLTSEGSLGPIGARCGNRKPGMSCKDYLFESITKPAAFVVSGYQPIMPDMTRTLPAEQVWAVIAFLESQGGTVDVTADDVHSAMQAAGAGGSGGQAAGGGAAPATAMRRLTASPCRISSLRPAPSAARTTSSRSRSDERTRRRLATLAQAMRSTKTTAPMMASTPGRAPATRSGG